MSTINEALRKAQRQRERGHQRRGWSLSSGRQARRPFSVGKVWGVSLGVMVIFLAFALYLWLNFGALRSPDVPEMASPTSGPAPPRPERTVSATASYDKARFYYKKGSMEEAKRCYREALRADPGYADALNNLGVIYLQERAYGEARASFEKAIRLKPGYVEPIYNLACLHAVRGESEGGLARLKQAIALEPSVREWARQDSDLKSLQNAPEFQKILGTGKDQP